MSEHTNPGANAFEIGEIPAADSAFDALDAEIGGMLGGTDPLGRYLDEASRAASAQAFVSARLRNDLTREEGKAGSELPQRVWYYETAGEARGPVPLVALQDLARQGAVTSDTSVWDPTTGTRIAAGEILELGLEAPKAARPGPSGGTASWYYIDMGESAGPVPESELGQWLRTGALPSNTHVWREGLEGWMEASAAGFRTRPEPARAESPAPASQTMPEYRCSRCGDPTDRTARFCHSCGAKILAMAPVQQTAPQAEERICPACGSPNSSSAKFCLQCGTLLGGPATAEAMPSAGLCQACGHRSSADATFCGGCGAPLRP